MTYAGIRTARKSNHWKPVKLMRATQSMYAALVKHGALNATAALR